MKQRSGFPIVHQYDAVVPAMFHISHWALPKQPAVHRAKRPTQVHNTIEEVIVVSDLGRYVVSLFNWKFQAHHVCFENCPSNMVELQEQSRL